MNTESVPVPLPLPLLNFPNFDKDTHCNNIEDCTEVDISGIISEDVENTDVFSTAKFIYIPSSGFSYPEVSNQNNNDLVNKFHIKLLQEIVKMSNNSIKRIEYRIQVDRGENISNTRLGQYLHRESQDLISFWVFQNINCKNTGTVIAKRVNDKTDVVKIPDNRSFIVNDSIYLHKAPKTWDILDKTKSFVRSILVADITLDNIKPKTKENHDLFPIINPMNLYLIRPQINIGGINSKRKTNKRKTNKRKTNKRKRN